MTLGSLLAVVFVVVVLGVIGYAIQRWAPMEGTIKSLAVGLVVLIAILVVLFWVFSIFGFHPNAGTRLF